MLPAVLATGIGDLENSAAVGKLSAILGFLFVGFVVLWFIAHMGRRIEAMIMPVLPILLPIGIVGVLGVGLFIHFVL